MSTYNEVDRSIAQLDLQDDNFRLESLDEDERVEAQEAADRVEESRRVSLFLAGFMTLIETAACSSLIMHHWSNERDSYYMDEDGQESLFYRDFEITNHGNQWLMVNEDDEIQNFCCVDLLEALRCIEFMNDAEEVGS